MIEANHLDSLDMFTICQGTCFCTASPDGKRGGQETVLYCFGEVVLKKDSLRGEQSEKALGPQTLDQYHLQLSQIVLIFILFMLV